MNHPTHHLSIQCTHWPRCSHDQPVLFKQPYSLASFSQLLLRPLHHLWRKSYLVKSGPVYRHVRISFMHAHIWILGISIWATDFGSHGPTVDFSMLLGEAFGSVQVIGQQWIQAILFVKNLLHPLPQEPGVTFKTVETMAFQPNWNDMPHGP